MDLLLNLHSPDELNGISNVSFSNFNKSLVRFVNGV